MPTTARADPDGTVRCEDLARLSYTRADARVKGLTACSQGHVIPGQPTAAARAMAPGRPTSRPHQLGTPRETRWIIQTMIEHDLYHADGAACADRP